MSKHKPKKERRKKTPDEPRTDGPDNGDNGPDETNSFFSGERKIWIIVSAVLFVACLIFLFNNMSMRGQLSDLHSNMNYCTIALDEAISEREDMAAEIRKMEYDMQALGMSNAGEKSIPEKYIELFQKRGIKRPVFEITTDLHRKHDIIPYEPSAPNRHMRFNNRNQIYLLSHNRALAYFTDGMAFGWLFLQYKVGEDGKISWKVLESYCPYYDK